MEDIFHWCREGNAMQVRVWLDDTEHDMNQGDDHGFSPLHWSCKEGHMKIVEMLLLRGARVNATNRGDDTPLHLASAHGHRDIVLLLLRNRADVNFTNSHGNSALHYASFWSYVDIAEDLVQHGALISLCNKDGDTARDKARGSLAQRLHDLAVESGQQLHKIHFKDQSWLGAKTRSRDATLSRHKGIHIKDLALQLLRNRADVNFTNSHGNSALHYASFWSYVDIAEDLVQHGALISLCNKDGDTARDKARGSLAQRLHDLAVESGQQLHKIHFKDQSWLGAKTRSRDATLSRHKGIHIKDLALQELISKSPSGDTWRGRWQKNDIVAKVLAIRECTSRISRDFNEEFPKLRIFSHPNVLPVVGCCNAPPKLVVINQYMPWGSLYNVLHEGTGVVVDTAQALRFAMDIARGMSFLHSLERIIPTYLLNSHHVMIDEDLTARINMADAVFSFQERGRRYHPAWMSPEALQRTPADTNWEAADMWSFAVTLWELATREVPFADLSAMECGMKVALEGLRVTVPPGISPHLSKLIKICMNEDPGKRPTFDMVMPILDKMKR